MAMISRCGYPTSAARRLTRSRRHPGREMDSLQYNHEYDGNKHKVWNNSVPISFADPSPSVSTSKTWNSALPIRFESRVQTSEYEQRSVNTWNSSIPIKFSSATTSLAAGGGGSAGLVQDSRRPRTGLIALPESQRRHAGADSRAASRRKEEAQRKKNEKDAVDSHKAEEQAEARNMKEREREALEEKVRQQKLANAEKTRQRRLRKHYEQKRNKLLETIRQAERATTASPARLKQDFEREWKKFVHELPARHEQWKRKQAEVQRQKEFHSRYEEFCQEDAHLEDQVAGHRQTILDLKNLTLHRRKNFEKKFSELENALREIQTLLIEFQSKLEGIKAELEPETSVPNHELGREKSLPLYQQYTTQEYKAVIDTAPFGNPEHSMSKYIDDNPDTPDNKAWEKLYKYIARSSTRKYRIRKSDWLATALRKSSRAGTRDPLYGIKLIEMRFKAAVLGMGHFLRQQHRNRHDYAAFASHKPAPNNKLQHAFDLALCKARIACDNWLFTLKCLISDLGMIENWFRILPAPPEFSKLMERAKCVQEHSFYLSHFTELVLKNYVNRYQQSQEVRGFTPWDFGTRAIMSHSYYWNPKRTHAERRPNRRSTSKMAATAAQKKAQERQERLHKDMQLLRKSWEQIMDVHYRLSDNWAIRILYGRNNVVKRSHSLGTTSNALKSPWRVRKYEVELWLRLTRASMFGGFKINEDIRMRLPNSAPGFASISRRRTKPSTRDPPSSCKHQHPANTIFDRVEPQRGSIRLPFKFHIEQKKKTIGEVKRMKGKKGDKAKSSPGVLVVKSNKTPKKKPKKKPPQPLVDILSSLSRLSSILAWKPQGSQKKSNPDSATELLVAPTNQEKAGLDIEGQHVIDNVHEENTIFDRSKKETLAASHTGQTKKSAADETNALLERSKKETLAASHTSQTKANTLDETNTLSDPQQKAETQDTCLPDIPWFSHMSYRDSDGNGSNKLKIHYCTKLYQSEREARNLLDGNETILGLDLEWLKFAKNEDPATAHVSLIQIAAPNRVVLFHIALHEADSDAELIAPSLRKLLESNMIIKTGVNILADCKRLEKHFGVKAQGIMELSHIHNLINNNRTLKGEIKRSWVSLAKLTKTHLGVQLNKEDEVRCSNWTQTLPYTQVQYAADDVYAGLQIFATLQMKRLALRPTPPSPQFAELNLPIVTANAFRSVKTDNSSGSGSSSSSGTETDDESPSFSCFGYAGYNRIRMPASSEDGSDTSTHSESQSDWITTTGELTSEEGSTSDSDSISLPIHQHNRTSKKPIPQKHGPSAKALEPELRNPYSKAPSPSKASSGARQQQSSASIVSVSNTRRRRGSILIIRRDKEPFAGSENARPSPEPTNLNDNLEEQLSTRPLSGPEQEQPSQVSVRVKAPSGLTFRKSQLVIRPMITRSQKGKSAAETSSPRDVSAKERAILEDESSKEDLNWYN